MVHIVLLLFSISVSFQVQAGLTIVGGDSPDATGATTTTTADDTYSNNQCNHNHDIATIMADPGVRAQCGPAVVAAGIQGGAAFAGWLAGRKAVKPVVSAAAQRISALAAGKLAGRIVLGANLVGLGVTAIQLMGLFAKGAAQARDCQFYEHELKRAVYDEVDERGRLMQEALEAAGFTLTDQQKRQLRVSPLKRENIDPKLHPDPNGLDSCGDVNLHANYMLGRQNAVYGDLVNGSMITVPIPEVPKHELSDWDKQMIGELYQDVNCMEAADVVNMICAVGNTILFGANLRRDILALRSSVRPTPERRPPTTSEIVADRNQFFRFQMAANQMFPQDTRAIRAMGAASLLKNPNDAQYYFHRLTDAELANMSKRAHAAHRAHGMDDIRFGDKALRKVFDAHSLSGASRGRDLISMLAFAERGRTNAVLRMPNAPPANTTRMPANQFDARNFDTARAMQTDAGRAFLNDVGSHIESTLRSAPMREISKEWRRVVAAARRPDPADVPRLTAEWEAVRARYEAVLTRSLVDRYPQLRQQVHLNDLNRYIPGFRMQVWDRGPETRTLAQWISYRLSSSN